MQATIPYLSLSIWIPIVSGLVLLAIGRDDRATLVRWLALIAAVVSFLVTIPLYLVYYAVEPMPGMLVAKQIACDSIVMILMGVVVSMIIKPSGAK